MWSNENEINTTFIEANIWLEAIMHESIYNSNIENVTKGHQRWRNEMK